MESNYNPYAQTPVPFAEAPVQTVRYCGSCGQQIDASVSFCPYCGAQVAEMPVRSAPAQPVYRAPAQPVYRAPAQPTVQQPQQAAPAQQMYPPYYQQPNIIINNTNTNANQNTVTNTVYVRGGREKNKWVSVLLCLFVGIFGGHKFYEGKIGMGILYLFTAGLFGIGCLIDFISLLFKPNPYYV